MLVVKKANIYHSNCELAEMKESGLQMKQKTSNSTLKFILKF